MIEPDIQEFKFTMDLEIPSHWRVIKDLFEINQLNNSKIIPIGNGDETFRKMILEGIKSAKHTVMLCSFILSDEKIIDAIIKAVERKVRCYLLFASEIQLRKEYNEDRTDFDERTLYAHKLMLDKFAGKVLARTSSHLHAKFLLIDIGYSSEKGFISTANFTAEALTRNQEIGVVLDEQERQEVFCFFRIGFWSESKSELKRIRHWDDVKQLKMINFSTKNIKTTYIDSNSLKKELISLIKQSNGSIFVSTYGIEVEHEITHLLAQKANKQKIVLLTRPREKNEPTIHYLAEKGVQIFAYEYLHAKFIYSVNQKRAIIMTANIEQKGLDTGFEIGIVVEGINSMELHHIISEWLKNAPLMWEEGSKVQEFNSGKIKIQKGRELVVNEIKDNLVINLDPVTPKDLLEMEQQIKEKPLQPNIPDITYPKEIILRRQINPPTLPPTAREVDARTYWSTQTTTETKRKIPRKFPILVYRTKKHYYGVVNSWKELAKSRNHSDLPPKIRFVNPTKA